MSHGCGKGVLLGLLLPWSQFITAIVGEVKVEEPALCADPEGEVRSARTAATYREHTIVSSN